ncbi:MAG: hypothetical protein V3V09_07975 [Arenicellales bacterium]
MKKIFQKAFILPLIIAISVVLVVAKVKSKPPVEHAQVGYPIKAVEVINAKALPFRARATAYGNVEPSVVVNAKAEVAGKIVYVHPDLEKGASLAEGTVVLRIEPTSFEISLDQSRAGLQGSESALVQLETEEKSTRSALNIARANLKVGQEELARTQVLFDKKLVARSSLDKEAQKVLSLRQQVQDIEGKLASFDSRKAATIAQISQSQGQVAQSQDTLGRTAVSMPFDARVGAVSVEAGEFVGVGAPLFTALGIKAVKIDAQLPVQQFRPLVAGASSAKAETMGQSMPAAINLNTPTEFQQGMDDLALEVKVRLIGESDRSIFWQGELIRISESVDPIRNTLALVVEVDNPYAEIIPGKKPPLLRGMSVEAEFFAPVQTAMVLPKKAVHQGRVYVVDADNKLSIEAINIRYTQGDLIVLETDSAEQLAGKAIIISDVIPVIEGMPLKPSVSDTAALELAEKALGAQPQQ